jgi:hypothetical protein
MRDIIFAIVAVAIVVVFSSFAISVGLEKQSIVHCERLKEQSETLSQFWITQNDKHICDSLGYSFAGTEQAPVNVGSVPEGELQNGIWYTIPGLTTWRLITHEKEGNN